LRGAGQVDGKFASDIQESHCVTDASPVHRQSLFMPTPHRVAWLKQLRAG